MYSQQRFQAKIYQLLLNLFLSQRKIGFSKETALKCFAAIVTKTIIQLKLSKTIKYKRKIKIARRKVLVKIFGGVLVSSWRFLSQGGVKLWSQRRHRRRRFLSVVVVNGVDGCPGGQVSATSSATF